MTYLPQPEGSTFTPPPSGTFPAVCYRILDLGTQTTSYQGKPSRKHKVLLSWELHDPEAVTDDGKPMTIHQSYTWSMHEKANLRKSLESWRGKKFSEADFGPTGFQIKNLLGKSCFLGIVHNDSDGTTYANISAISKLPKGMAEPEPVNPMVYSWIDPDLFDKQAFSELSDKLQEKIKSSPEYQRMVAGKSEHVMDADNENPAYGLDDEIPFEKSWK